MPRYFIAEVDENPNVHGNQGFLHAKGECGPDFPEDVHRTQLIEIDVRLNGNIH